MSLKRFLPLLHRDIKFGPITDGTGGWNVISSTETSDDGKARTEKMLATTEGVSAVDGGKKAFSGKNEELKTERYDGDANNFTHSTGESSNMTLNENIVTGDDSNKRVEKKSSSVSHSSKVVRSSANTGDSTGFDDDFQNLSTRDHDLKSSSNERTSTTHSDHQRNSSDVRNTSDVRNSAQSRNESVDLSQESATVKEAFRLAQQPGKVISRKVERANPTTNMITEKKELVDGTVVTTKRYETISSDHVDIQATTHDNRSNVKTHEVKKTSENVNKTHEANKTSQNAQQTHEVNKTSQNVNQTFKTARDEEAFRLSQQPGTVISHNVEMTDPTTRLITEKKELTDGTIVTTKRFEKVTSSSDHTSNVNSGSNVTREHFVDTQSTESSKNDAKTTSNHDTSEDVRKTSTNETFKTSRDEEAFRLSQLPGKVISRDVQLTNPTTRLITEKKELNDGTIVTTKRYESINSDTQSSKNITREHNIDVHSKNLRSDSTASKTDQVKDTTRNVNETTHKVNETFKTARDEEAFRLSQQPGTVISRNVEMTNPTTRLITEKKELTDGTVVTTRRYETVDTASKNFSNVDSQNVRIFVVNTDARQSTFDNSNDREVVEEMVTKKIFDTSCHCDETNPDHKLHSKQFINQERNDDRYDITSEIITDVHDRSQTVKKDLAESERIREETIKREEVRKLEQKRVDDQIRRERLEQSSMKITRELEVDAAHKAFVSSLRCVTPPNERMSTPHIPRNENRSNRSQSRETNTSKISSSTTTIRKSTQNDVHNKNEVRRSSTKSSSPEKSPKKVTPDSRRSTTEFVETIEVPNKAKRPAVGPQKVTQSSPGKVQPQKAPHKAPEKSSPRYISPDSRDSSPNKSPTRPSDISPTKPSAPSARSGSPTKYPSSLPREISPTKTHPSSRASTPRDSSPEKSYPRSGSSTPRGVSQQKYPASSNTSRDTSPIKPTMTKRDNELFSSTVVIDNKKRKDDLKIFQTIDTKNMSATTSVSDLEYIPASRRPVTDLDSDFQIKINVSDFDQTEDLTITTTLSEVDDVRRSSKKPEDKRPEYKRSETFEERARKLIGVTPDNENDSQVPSYAKPTYASLPTANRVSEIRERKAKIEEIENSTTSKKKSVTCETEDFIAREKNESRRRSTQAFSSPDQSPTRNTSKKPNEQRPNETTSKTNVTKTSKTTETRHASPEKKKPVTNKKTTIDQPKRFDETRSPAKPGTHITVAKIHITPQKNVTTTLPKPTVETKKNIKIAPSIRLVKRPTTDLSSTEPDSDFETDQELIKNIDKSTSKSTRKKLLQSRKDSAPVTKTTVMTDKEKATRSVTENLFRTDKSSTSDRSSTTKKSTAVQPRDVHSRESSPKKDSKRPTKCVTTKTINLKNVNTINSNTLDDVVIDVVQAKSSREPSPNKVVPTPVRPDEVINGHQMIYPDKVTEPDDVRKQKPKVKNIPIFAEKTNQFIGIEITEVETAKSPIILEEDEIDEHDRIVINSSTLERADRKRNSVQIDALSDEDLDDQSHLMSVSQKVNKFISTAEELKKPKTSSPFNAEDVRLEDVSEPEDDSMLTVNRKVTKFSTANDESSTYERKQRVDKSMTRPTDEVDEIFEDDECLLSVSDKVNKFISSAEKLRSSAPQKSPELVKNIMKTSTKSTRKSEKAEDINESFLTKEKVSIHTRDNRSESRSPVKSTGSDITLKSTEAIKRARAAFETNTADRDTRRHDDIISRPSVWEAKRTPTAERKVYKEPVIRKTSAKSPSRERQSQSPTKDYESKSPSPCSPRRESSDRTTPVYMRDQVSTKKDLFEKRISSTKLESETFNRKSLSPQTSVDDKNRQGSEEVHHSSTRRTSSDKHYMSHTVASLEHVVNDHRELEVNRTSRSGSRRDSGSRSPTKVHRNISESTNDSGPYESPRTPTKFGVELKRAEVRQSRRSSTNVETINIEEIFDLVELEKLLEVVVGYEQRRRIRAQIRLVRNKISERKTSVENKTRTSTTSTFPSPTRKPRDREEQTIRNRTITEKPAKLSTDDSRVQKVITTTTKTTTRQSSDKPREVTQTRTTRVTNEKVQASSPRLIIENLNKNSKAKTSENVVKIVKKNSATSSTQKSNSTRESKTDTDCVTSSYGVGPTDSNGLPLFGLKALKKKAPVTTSSKSKFKINYHETFIY